VSSPPFWLDGPSARPLVRGHPESSGGLGRDYTGNYSTARLEYSISGQPPAKSWRSKGRLRTVGRFGARTSRFSSLIASRASVDVPREALLNEGRDRGATECGAQDDFGNLYARWIA
jgi:hypothetical protein